MVASRSEPVGVSLSRVALVDERRRGSRIRESFSWYCPLARTQISGKMKYGLRIEGGEEDGAGVSAGAAATAPEAEAEVERSSLGALNRCAVAAREPYSIRTGVDGTPRGSAAVPDDVAVADES